MLTMETISQYLASGQYFASSQPLTTAILATGMAAIIVAYNDYRYYVSMGPHGLPDNWWGWYKQLRMSCKARKDTTVPVPYDLAETAKTNGPNSTKSFFARPLELRSGTRPEVCGFVAPQRQLTERCSDAMRRAMNAYLDNLVMDNAAILQRENSKLEGPVPAVQLREGSPFPSFLEATRGEFVHIHPPDGSTHLVLSLVDSAEAIEKGWGQRHRLSGGMLTWGYTLIYAPRDEQDFHVWKNIVGAAANFSVAEIGQLRLPAD
ncbi:hypothetical protein BKA67DRAFT_581695, partial [Truncatella angustata]